MLNMKVNLSPPPETIRFNYACLPQQIRVLWRKLGYFFNFANVLNEFLKNKLDEYTAQTS